MSGPPSRSPQSLDAVASSAPPRPAGTRRRLLARWVLLALAIGLPYLLLQGTRKQAAKHQALLDHGRTTDALVTEYNKAAGTWFARFEYQVEGQRYTGSVERDLVPAAEGVPFPITYLPEHPAHYWAGPPLTAEVVAEESRPKWVVILWPAVLFGAPFVANEFDLRRRRRAAATGAGVEPGPLLSSAGSARLVTVLFFAVMLGVQFDPKARAKMVEAFGPRPLGLPNLVVVLAATALLYLPFVWVFRHLTLLVHRGFADGGGPYPYLNLLGGPPLPDDLRHSRTISLLGVVYFFATAAAWIAYAAYRGI